MLPSSDLFTVDCFPFDAATLIKKGSKIPHVIKKLFFELIIKNNYKYSETGKK
jgi:hypothetical protein